MINVCDITITDYPQHFLRGKQPTPALVISASNFGRFLSKIKPNDSAEYIQVVEEWKDSFAQLREAQDHRNYNANVPMPSQNAVSTISRLLADIFEIAPALAAPAVVPDGEGGLHLESRNAERYISIQIDADRATDRIFVKDAAGMKSYPVANETLKVLFR